MGEKFKQTAEGKVTPGEQLTLANEMMTDRDEKSSELREKNVKTMLKLAKTLREQGLSGFENMSAEGNHIFKREEDAEGSNDNRNFIILEGYVGGEPIKLVFENDPDNSSKKYTANIGATYLYDENEIEKLFNKLNSVAMDNNISYKDSAKELRKARANLMLKIMANVEL